MQKRVKYEACMITQNSRRGTEKGKFVAINNIGHTDLTFYGTQVYLCARYEVSVIKPVVRRIVHGQLH